MKKLTFLVLGLVIILTGIMVIGCGGGDKNNILPIPLPGTTNAQNQQTYALPGADTKWEFGDIPKYPGASEAYKMRGEEPGEPPVIMEHVVYITGDSAQKAGDYYRSKMADTGWEEAYWGEMTGGFIGSFTKPDDVGAAIGIATNDKGQTMITIDKRYPKS